MFFKVEHVEGTRKTLKNHQICPTYAKDLAKNEEKSCSFCIEPIFWLIPGILKSDFRVPYPSLKRQVMCLIFLCLAIPFFKIAMLD